MNIQLSTVREGFDGETCYVHSRIGAADKDGTHLVLTTQKLILAGSDTFLPLCRMVSHDGGRSWSEPFSQTGFQWPDRVVCDFVPAYHASSGKLLGFGGSVSYLSFDPPVLDHKKPQQAFFSVYDEKNDTWGAVKRPINEKGEPLSGFTAACCRRFDLPDGDILQPVYRRLTPGGKYSVNVIRFGFDGEDLIYREEGNLLSMESEARGLCEPSLVRFDGVYYLTLRADSKGFISTSTDGLHFSEPKVWTWDTGLEVPTYNTQQNWVVGKDGLYLVYTRRNGRNDHVFRNRAPLYLCRVDTDNLCLLRNTEIPLTPERGARCGNFGVTHLSQELSIVVTSEWMQPLGCEKYGSNNALFAVWVMS